ncbi:MAG: hypothetical protein Q8N87_00440 [bacterium]|nr:hypothetical protein [bacterium]
MDLKNLQKKYPRFIYEKYSRKISGNNLEIFFDFCIEPDIRFKPKIIIENIDRNLLKLDFNKLNNLIFHLGLMEIPSYWKATCSPEIIVKAGALNSEQIKWWKDLIMKGMGQFFYENRINFKKPNFFTIKCLNVKIPSNLLKLDFNRFKLNGGNEVLVPVGGGKDSAVTLELMKKAGKDVQCFSLNPTGAVLKTMKVAGCKKPIVVRREIDKKLLELNRKRYLNGHTPFSAYLAFLSVLAAAIFGQKYIALSNERSSNEGNIKYLGRIINHQWSKSFEFEQKFRNYCKRYLTPVVKEDKSSFPPSSRLQRDSVIEYFSFLRPLYEIQIAKLFGKYPKYFPVFLSCNEAYKTASGTKLPAKKWCGKCSKCLFVFTILYPFLTEKELLKIFGKNLFEDKTLLPIMQELMGERGFKPFECVGTKKESLAAFYLSLRSFIRRGAKPPFLLQYFEEKILPKYPNLKQIAKKILTSWNKQNNLLLLFDKFLKSAII